MGRLLSVVLLLALVQLSGWSQTSEEMWRSATEQYESGDYEAARSNYLLMSGEKPSSELYYNLGNCYFHLDSVAQSILYFEKAIKLDPRNDAARENLELAVERMDNPIPAIEEFFLKRWLNGLSDLLPPMGWGILCLVILWLIAWMLVRSVRRGTMSNDRLKYILPVFAFTFLIFIAYASYQNLTESEYAIVMDGYEVKVAPDPLSATTRSISEGEKVMIIDALDNYYKVRFVNYEHGWLPLTAVKRI
jgi:hypothetical protein